MPIPTITATRTINAPPERVWAAITDIGNAPHMLTCVLDVAVLTQDEFGVGYVWSETRRMFGKDAAETMTVVAMQPGVAYTAEACNFGARYISSFQVDPVGSDATELTFTFAAESVASARWSQRIMMRIFGSIGKRATHRMIETDLDDIASYIGRHG
ncbi:SRPBCC family protein [Plantibacter sp. RU18]|uniref:SRPBCC family protein n=1 Tax=Plantibacter sp. RU18 TaxID=3158143 RepID=UPI003D36B3EA